MSQPEPLYDLWKAVAHLKPNAQPFHDHIISDINDGNGQFFSFWDTAILGEQPTRKQIVAAITAYNAAQTAIQQEATALRQQVLTLAQSAVGVSITALTAAQVRALVAILLWKAGAIKADGTVRPLAEWVRD